MFDALFKTINLEYTKRIDNLQKVYNDGGPRKCANESGEVFEKFIDDFISHIPHLKSIKNDYLTTECGGYTMKNVQVDRHIRAIVDNAIKVVIEGKVYLDSCYCKRAVVDFIEIGDSVEASDDLKFVILVGQLSISPNTLNYYREFCKKHTGRYFEVYVINEEKVRNSNKPLYKEKFKLDIQEVKNFYDFITSL
jgi:hypothetical protein